MENREQIIEILNKVIEEITNLKDDIASNKRDVEEITKIKKKLTQVEEAVKPKQKWFKEKIESLKLTLKELRQIRNNMILGMTGEMFEIIDKNLLDGMELENVDTNKNIKTIVFDKTKIGSIEVLEEHSSEVKIRVTVYENSDKFDVNDPNRMYSIISFINTKFNYKEI